MRDVKRFLVFCVLVLGCGLAAGQCAPCTIWPPSAAPTLADGGDTSSIEVGLKFQAASAGYVTGVRFYKSANNIGTHIGNLWSSSGSLLATAQFTGESASGWQQVTFTTPVLISSGTTYIVSYFAPFSHYSADENFFATSGVDNPPLDALSNSSSGGNGVYTYSASSAFPTSSWNASNYWVDLVYVSQNSTAAPVVASPTPGNGTTGAALGGAISAQFSEPMNPATITPRRAIPSKHISPR